MIHSPTGSTPFSVKDILNLEQTHMGCSPKEDSKTFAEIRECNGISYFGVNPSYSMNGINREAINSALSKSDPFHGSYISGSINLAEEVSSTESPVLDSSTSERNKADADWAQFHHMATPAAAPVTKYAASDEQAECSSSDVCKSSSIQAAASTLLDFSHHLHNQTYPEKFPHQQGGPPYNEFSDLYNLDYCRLNRIAYNESFSSTLPHQEAQSLSYTVSSCSKPKFPRPSANDPTMMTLQPARSSNLDKDLVEFNVSASEQAEPVPHNVPKSSSPFQNHLSLNEEPRPYPINCYVNLSSPSSNKQSSLSEQLSETTSPSQSSAVSNFHRQHSSQDSPQPPVERDTNCEELIAQITGE